MALLAQLEQRLIQADRRSSKRWAINLRLSADTPASTGVPVVIHDLSVFGILIETRPELAVGTTLDIELPEAGSQSAKVIWRRAGLIGCEFEQPISNASLSAALLRSNFGPKIEPPAAYAQQSAHEEPNSDKLPLRTRFTIIVACAIACWAVCLATIAWIIA